MLLKHTFLAAAILAGTFAQKNGPNGQNNGQNNGQKNDKNSQNNTNLNGGNSLQANAIQDASANDGAGGDPAQAKSLTSSNNFINFCAGKNLTNGLQNEKGSCNGIPMGDIPAKSHMVSSVITFPETGGQPVPAYRTFNITVQMSNLVTGSFTNPKNTYYSAPQQLQGGKIVGHIHVTLQDMGESMNPTKPLDATQFAFFKGINDDGNGQGLLQATVTGGLPAGNYRVCTMSSASNHQPVLMPVAQRGTPDDCTKFVVANGDNANANAGGQGGRGAQADQGVQAKGKGQVGEGGPGEKSKGKFRRNFDFIE